MAVIVPAGTSSSVESLVLEFGVAIAWPSEAHPVGVGLAGQLATALDRDPAIDPGRARAELHDRVLVEGDVHLVGVGPGHHVRWCLANLGVGHQPAAVGRTFGVIDQLLASVGPHVVGC